MKKTTLTVLIGIAVMVFVFYCASTGNTPAHTLSQLVDWFFQTFPKA